MNGLEWSCVPPPSRHFLFAWAYSSVLIGNSYYFTSRPCLVCIYLRKRICISATTHFIYTEISFILKHAQCLFISVVGLRWPFVTETLILRLDWSPTPGNQKYSLLCLIIVCCGIQSLLPPPSGYVLLNYHPFTLVLLSLKKAPPQWCGATKDVAAGKVTHTWNVGIHPRMDCQWLILTYFTHTHLREPFNATTGWTAGRVRHCLFSILTFVIQKADLCLCWISPWYFL